ncbi:MFS transporter [Cellulomonas sp. C5510]|uniref:MFS transporter n=1 Tax=Cellulomonas sp. C5510 TaxID=2871170 RepID=UPI0021044724|nr:MFS transporter [Cellulomonas sp. C5510]
MLGTYRDVLDRPGALAFSGAGVIARLPMSMVGIGIILMIESLHGSYRLAGAVSAAYVLAQAVCSPQLARLVDQHGQARVMRPALTVSAVALVALVLCATLDAPVWTLYATAVLVGATIGSFGALVRARWSHVLSDPRSLHTAYSLESALDELVFVVGPILATTLATAVAPSAGLVVPVVGMVLGGYWFLAQRRTEPPPHGRRPVGPDGVRARRVSVMRSGGMVVLAVVFVAMGSIFGATDVSTVAFAEEAGRQALAGVVLAVFACGSMISGLLYGARHWVTPLWRRFAIGMVALAVGVSLFVLVSSMTMLAVVMFVVGFAIAPTLVNGNGLVQHFVARERLTEGLTWVGTSLGVGVSLGSWVAGSMIDRQGSHGGYLVVVGSAALAVVAVLASLRTLRAGNPDARVPAGGGPDDPPAGDGTRHAGTGPGAGDPHDDGAGPGAGAAGDTAGPGAPEPAVPPDRSAPTTLPVPMDVPGTERLAPVADDTTTG